VAKAKGDKTPQASATASPAKRVAKAASPATSTSKSDPFAAPAADPFATSSDPFASPAPGFGSQTPASNPGTGGTAGSGSRRPGRGRPAPKQVLGALDASAFESVSAAPAAAATPLPVKSVLEAAPAAGSDPFAAPSNEEADPFAALARDVEVPAAVDEVRGDLMKDSRTTGHRILPRRRQRLKMRWKTWTWLLMRMGTVMLPCKERRVRRLIPLHLSLEFHSCVEYCRRRSLR
jgi:hypothetical protein